MNLFILIKLNFAWKYSFILKCKYFIQISDSLKKSKENYCVEYLWHSVFKYLYV